MSLHIITPTRLLAMLVIGLLLVAGSGCGGGGGGSGTSVTQVAVQTTDVVLSGSAEHPHGGTITVTVDGIPATVTAGTWSHTLAFTGASATPVIRLYRNGTLVSVRQVNVSRGP
jgi:hypothetical protein